MKVTWKVRLVCLEARKQFRNCCIHPLWANQGDSTEWDVHLNAKINGTFEPLHYSTRNNHSRAANLHFDEFLPWRERERERETQITAHFTAHTVIESLQCPPAAQIGSACLFSILSAFRSRFTSVAVLFGVEVSVLSIISFTICNLIT